MRRTTTLTALLLGASLLAPTGSATAAGETCRNVPATIVGTGAAIAGTPRNDVIVTGTSSVVDAGDGDDLICVTGSADMGTAVSVHAGTGDDIVVSTAMPAKSELAPVLDAGPGADSLWLEAVGVEYVLDVSVQSTTIDRVRELSFTSFEDYLIENAAGDRSITAIGTAGHDDIVIEGTARLDARLGAGDDQLTVGAAPVADTTIDLGEGTDLLRLRGGEQALDLDLEDKTLDVDGRRSASVTGVEDAFLVARDVVLEGDRFDNELDWRGCFGKINGGAGKDELELTSDATWETPRNCDRTRILMSGGQGNDTIIGKLYPTRILGGGGNDKLTGSSKSDVIFGGAGRDRLFGRDGADKLVGGAGRDRADGGPGRDTCSAEVIKDCTR